MNRILSLFILLAVTCRLLQAQSPAIHSSSTALMPGKQTVVHWTGENLAGLTGVWTSVPADVELLSLEGPQVEAKNRVGFRILVDQQLPTGIGAVRLHGPQGLSNWHLIMVDPLHSVSKTETNHAMASAQALALPVAVEGHGTELLSDFFQFKARAGQTVSVEVVAARLGSSMDPLIRLLDARGNELGYGEDSVLFGADPAFSYKIPATGKYYVEVRDTRYQGGAKYFYRLRAGKFRLAPYPFFAENLPSPVVIDSPTGSPIPELEPNDTLASGTPLPLPATAQGTFAKPRDRDFYRFEAAKNQRLMFSVKSRSRGFPGDVYLRLTQGGEAGWVDLKVADNDREIASHTFTEAGTHYLLAEELNGHAVSLSGYQLEIKPWQPGFYLSVAADLVEAAPGGAATLKVTAVRRDFDGPITLRLEPNPSGLTVTNNLIPAKKNDTELKIVLLNNQPGGHWFHIFLIGRAKAGETEIESRVSTAPALKTLFPNMVYPPEALDGLIALSIKPVIPPAKPAAEP